MVRSIVRKIMWVGRATVFLVGLTVIFAVVLGVATTAAAHSGSRGLFHLGHDNPVTSLSKMTGSVANGVLQITNQSTNNTTQDASAITATNNSNGSPTIRASNNRGSPAMELNVACQSFSACTRGAPLTVNSRTKVDLLNSDLLDGMDSTEFISDYQLVETDFTPTDSGHFKFRVAECPLGMQVLGGGYAISGGGGHVVATRSEPSGLPPHQWIVEAIEIGTDSPATADVWDGDWALRAKAICAKTPATTLP